MDRGVERLGYEGDIADGQKMIEDMNESAEERDGR